MTSQLRDEIKRLKAANDDLHRENMQIAQLSYEESSKTADEILRLKHENAALLAENRRLRGYDDIEDISEPAPAEPVSAVRGPAKAKATVSAGGLARSSTGNLNSSLMAYRERAADVTPEVRELFTAIDKDKDGLISAKEFQKAFTGKRKEALQPLLSNVGVGWNEVFKTMDSDGNGNIDLPEFQTHIENVKAFAETFSTDPSVQSVFELIDLDGDGVITTKEFQKAFTGKRKSTLLPLLSNAGVSWNEVFKVMDTDGNNTIDINEFQKHVNNVKAYSATMSSESAPDLLLY
jgi:Ca2+-binding EF-hand superfamily protein